MTNREALMRATRQLQDAGVENPRLDAGVLLQHVWGFSTVELFNNLHVEMDCPVQNRFLKLVERRAKREPLQYLTGKQEFMSLEFHVSPDVLIPRGDTEILVEEGLGLISRHGFRRCADVGTGSGAIACSIAHYTDVTVWATDISPRALAVARRNAAATGVAHRVDFLHGDLLEPLAAAGIRVELLTANLPYIPTAQLDTLAPELGYEPVAALDGGADGLDYYRRLLPRLGPVLEPGGFLLIEIGWDQGELVSRLAREYGLTDYQLLKDYGNRDRIFKIRYGQTGILESS